MAEFIHSSVPIIILTCSYRFFCCLVNEILKYTDIEEQHYSMVLTYGSRSIRVSSDLV